MSFGVGHYAVLAIPVNGTGLLIIQKGDINPTYQLPYVRVLQPNDLDAVRRQVQIQLSTDLGSAAIGSLELIHQQSCPDMPASRPEILYLYQVSSFPVGDIKVSPKVRDCKVLGLGSQLLSELKFKHSHRRLIDIALRHLSPFD